MTNLPDETSSTLQTLRDLKGILGSFLVADTGVVIAQDLPAYFGAAASDIAPRVQRLQEALSLNQGPLNQCVLRYGEHKLSLRPVQGGLLTIVASNDVNLPALRVASNLVAKKLPPLATLARAASESTPPPTLEPHEPAESETQAPPPSRRAARAILFRGKRVR